MLPAEPPAAGRPAAAHPRSICFRCGAILVRGGRIDLDGALALTLSAIPLFIGATTLPLMQLAERGNGPAATVFRAIQALHDQGMSILAALVLSTAVVLPAVHLAGTSTLLLGARRGWQERPLLPLVRLLEVIRPWAQLEILLLGSVVAFGKLTGVFRMAPGVGLACMAGFLLLEGAVSLTLDPRQLCQSVANAPQRPTPPVRRR
jgi:paraquat-inducible protein A